MNSEVEMRLSHVAYKLVRPLVSICAVFDGNEGFDNLDGLFNRSTTDPYISTPYLPLAALK